MLTSLLALVGGSSASADPIPPTNWSPVTIGSDPGATKVETDASGGVTVGCPSSNHSTGFKSYDSSGALVQSRPLGDPQAVFCTTDSVVGKDGTVYVTAGSLSSPTQYYVQAWKNNSLVWQYTIPCGSNTYPDSMVMGADGNMYMVVQYGGGSCSGHQLIGLSPTAQSGSNPPAPQAVMNQALSVGWVSSNGLAAYNDGLVLYTSSGIKYVEYSGSSGSPVAVANILQSYYVQTTENWFASTTSGRVFVPTRANAGASAGCSDANNVVGSIVAVDPAAQNSVAWTINISACMYVHEIHPLPNNGFVMRYGYVTPGSSASPSERITAFDGSGQAMWTQTVQDVSQVGSYAMSADLNGNVVLRADVALWHPINGSTWRFPEIDLTLFNGLNGATLSQVNLRGEFDTPNGPSYKGGNAGELSMAKNTFYVTAQQCTNLSYCDASSTKLYAFTVPGLEVDYPRGAILKHDEPWKNAVAMGDSFSSGQGSVLPYESGTDTAGPPENRCRRSPGAYAHLLNGEPGPRLNLAAFVACGGSTTSDVENGRFNEDLQLKAITDHDPDVITITIGGNDVGFKELVQECITNNPVSGDCSDSSAYAYTRDQIDNHLASNLSGLFGQISSRINSTTRVLVLGYPMLIPDPAINTLPNCLYLSHDDKVTAQGVINDLNQKISDAVAAAGPHFEYVDPNMTSSPFKGHELCMDGGYFNGVVAPPNDSSSFHPNALGQDAYRWVVAQYLTTHP